MKKYQASEISKWLHHIFGLVFLDPDEVESCYVEDFMTDCPNDDRVKLFLDYFVDNYLDVDATYPPYGHVHRRTRSEQLVVNTLTQ